MKRTCAAILCLASCSPGAPPPPPEPQQASVTSQSPPGAAPRSLAVESPTPDASEPAAEKLPGDLEVEVRSIDTSHPEGALLLLAPRDGSLFLPIAVGPAEALAIAVEINDISLPRPMTHDLMRDLLVATGTRLISVRVSEFDGSTFHARLRLQTGGRELNLDARPSDAIALALRAGVPVFVSAQVLERAAVRRPTGPGSNPTQHHGLSLQELTPALRRSLGLGDATGALVSEVLHDSAAAAAGLAPGDLLTAVSGRPIATPDEFTEALRQVSAPLELSVLRRGKNIRLQLARD